VELKLSEFQLDQSQQANAEQLEKRTLPKQVIEIDPQPSFDRLCQWEGTKTVSSFETPTPSSPVVINTVTSNLPRMDTPTPPSPDSSVILRAMMMLQH
jgi:hypothetical protein